MDPVGRILALAYARRDEGYAARNAALRQRESKLGAGRQRRRDARHDLVAHAGRLERGNFFLGATEEHRIAAFEANDDRVSLRRVDEPFVDELLRGGVFPAAFADGDLFGAGGERHRIGMHQRIVEDDVGLREQFRRAQREQVRRAGSGANEIDDAAHAASLCQQRRL